MTKQNLETEYCNERGDSSFNNYNNNDYTKWLETKLIETEKQLILSGVIGSFSADDMEKAFDAGAYEHHIKDAKTFVKNYR